MLIRVLYQNGKFDMVKPSILNALMASDELKSFCRSDGWVIVGSDPTRGTGGMYKGRERRTLEKSELN